MFNVNRLTSKNARSPECDALSFHVRFRRFEVSYFPHLQSQVVNKHVIIFGQRGNEK
jgi:hypothetical protein